MLWQIGLRPVGKNLTTIYIPHMAMETIGFGVGTLLERFPNGLAVATPEVVKVMRQNASPERLWIRGWKVAERIPKRQIPRWLGGRGGTQGECT